MSFNESVSDLNSKEFRSPPSARHCRRRKQKPHSWYFSQLSTKTGRALILCIVWEKLFCALFTLICSNIAVSLEIRSVKFSLSTQSCPVDEVFACLTTS